MIEGKKKLGWAVGLVAAGAVGGGLLMLAVPAAADPTPSPSSTSSTSPEDAIDPAAGPGGHGGRGGGQRGDETVLTGTDAEKATAAALVALPGATVDRVETDADGAAYEAHVTRSDGAKATVKFDQDFNVTGVEDGMGAHK